MSVHSCLALAALSATLAVPLAARAEPEPTGEITLAPTKDVAAPAKASSWRWPEVNLAFGFRVMNVTSAGLDPFATDNGVAQLSLAAGPTLLKRGPVSIAALAEWDYGTLDATARGDKTSLTMHRLGVGLETRFQLAYRLMMFAKLSPAAVNLRGTIDDPGFSRQLVSRTWSWSLDTTGGLAVMFASTGPRTAPTSRLWFTGELGYGFAGQSDMVFAPETDAEDPRKYGSVMLPALRPSGALGRMAMMVSF